LPALARWRVTAWRSRLQCCRAALGNGGQQSLAVAERGDAKFFQIRVVELGKNHEIDVILGEHARVLPEPQRFKPCFDIHAHSVAQISGRRTFGETAQQLVAMGDVNKRGAPYSASCIKAMKDST
jgi:hypothetical protein